MSVWWGHTCHSTRVLVRGQRCGVNSFLPPSNVFQGSSSQHQALAAIPLPDEPFSCFASESRSPKVQAWSPFVIENALGLLILLSQPPKCRDYRHVPLYPAWHWSFVTKVLTAVISYHQPCLFTVPISTIPVAYSQPCSENSKRKTPETIYVFLASDVLKSCTVSTHWIGGTCVALFGQHICTVAWAHLWTNCSVAVFVMAMVWYYL